MELLRRKVARYIRDNALCRPGDLLVVAFSGGADSTALLDILVQLDEFKLQLVVAHLNHLLRGAEADEDELFAKETAARYRIPFELARIDVAALAGARGLSLEEAGREARYAFFREVAAQHAAAAVAVGHHQNDQAETVLLRLLRGAGGSGLSGMRPKSAGGTIVRPLLAVSRHEIEAYLRKRGLAWREDSSNTDVGFLRNRVRHELLPYLEGCSPAIVERLQQTAVALAADEDVLESAAAEVFRRAVSLTEAGAAACLEILLKEPSALRKRLYRQAIRTVKGDLRRISFAHLAAIDTLVFANRPNSELTLPGGVRAVRSYQTLLFTTSPGESLPVHTEQLLARPGLYVLPCGGSLLIEERLDPLSADHAVSANMLAVAAGTLQFPLTVRYFRSGDRFMPLGMSHRKKLKNLFIDRKIPLHVRKSTPLLVDRGEIVWVCGIQAAVKMRRPAVGHGQPWLQLTYTAAAERH